MESVKTTTPNETPEIDLENIPEDMLWKTLQDYLYCTSYKDLERRVAQIKNKIPPLKERNEVFLDQQFEVDCILEEMYPSDGPQAIVPVKIYGDGDCLPRALSLCFFSNDDHHIELRVRMIVEAVLNKEKYLDGKKLLRGAQKSLKKSNLPAMWLKHSYFYQPEAKMTPEYKSVLYNTDVLDILRRGSEMGIF